MDEQLACICSLRCDPQPRGLYSTELHSSQVSEHSVRKIRLRIDSVQQSPHLMLSDHFRCDRAISTLRLPTGLAPLKTKLTGRRAAGP